MFLLFVIAVGYSPTGKVVWRQLYFHTVAHEYAHMLVAHTSGECAEDDDAVVEPYTEAVASECFGDKSFGNDIILLAHCASELRLTMDAMR